MTKAISTISTVAANGERGFTWKPLQTSWFGRRLPVPRALPHRDYFGPLFRQQLLRHTNLQLSQCYSTKNNIGMPLARSGRHLSASLKHSEALSPNQR
ncbi:MAG TPA: hypothetical protein VF666_10980 [Pyrinomonadaceae bacterium]